MYFAMPAIKGLMSWCSAPWTAKQSPYLTFSDDFPEPNMTDQAERKTTWTDVLYYHARREYLRCNDAYRAISQPTLVTIDAQ